MEILKSLKPSEAYFLISALSFDEKFMKYTLGNLLFNNSLELITVAKRAHPSAKRLTNYKMLRAGNGLNKTNYSRDESEFINYFGNGGKNYQIRLFAKLFSKQLDKKKINFKRDLIMKSTALSPYVNTNTITTYLWTRNSLGKKIGGEIEEYLLLMETKLLNAIEDQNEKQIEKLLAELGPHFLLLNKIDSKLLKNLKGLFKHFDTSQFISDTGYFWFDSGFDSFTDSFSSFEGMGGDFGGGGASDSWGDGCSGCSGCGD